MNHEPLSPDLRRRLESERARAANSARFLAGLDAAVGGGESAPIAVLRALMIQDAIFCSTGGDLGGRVYGPARQIASTLTGVPVFGSDAPGADEAELWLHENGHR